MLKNRTLEFVMSKCKNMIYEQRDIYILRADSSKFSLKALTSQTLPSNLTSAWLESPSNLQMIKRICTLQNSACGLSLFSVIFPKGWFFSSILAKNNDVTVENWKNLWKLSFRSSLRHCNKNMHVRCCPFFLLMKIFLNNNSNNNNKNQKTLSTLRLQ